MEMNRYLYHCNVRNLTKLTIHHLNETLKPFRQILSTTPSYFAAKMVNTLEDAGDSVRFFLSIIINSDKKQQRKTARKATEIITTKKK